jgi:hypothetical protein
MARIFAFDILNRSSGQAMGEISGGMRCDVQLAGFNCDHADLRRSI